MATCLGPRHRPFPSGRSCPGRGSGRDSWAMGFFSEVDGGVDRGSVGEVSPTAEGPASGTWKSEARGGLADTWAGGTGTGCERHSNTAQGSRSGQGQPGAPGPRPRREPVTLRAITLPRWHRRARRWHLGGWQGLGAVPRQRLRRDGLQRLGRLRRRATHLRSIRQQPEDELPQARPQPGMALQLRPGVEALHLPQALPVLAHLHGRRVLAHHQAIGRHSQGIHVIRGRGLVVAGPGDEWQVAGPWPPGRASPSPR